MCILSRLIILKFVLFGYVVFASLNDLLRPFEGKSSYEQFFHVVCCLLFVVCSRFNLKALLFIIFMLLWGVLNISGGAYWSSVAIQVFYLIAAFFAYLFGEQLVKHQTPNELLYKLENTLKLCGVVFFIMFLFYLGLFLFGYINRLGHSMPIVLISSYFFSRKVSFLWLIAPILSFKRAVFFSYIAGLFLSRSNKRAFFIAPLFLIFFLSSLFIFDDVVKEFLPRWSIKNLIDSDRSFDSINALTSGRLLQWREAFEKDLTLFEFLFGNGLGVTYFYDVGEVKWYVHNAYLTIFNIYGIFGILILLYFLLKIVLIERKASSFLKIYLIYVVISSLFSAKLIVDPIFWIFMGICNENIRKQRLGFTI